MIAALVRGLDVLTLLAERGGLRVDTLAADLDLPLSTAYRYVGTLCRSGFLEEVDGTYVPGGRLLRLARVGNRHDSLVRSAQPILRSLVTETQETALLTVRAGTMALCLDRAESPRPVRLSLDTGALRPLYAGASAKILLAFAPDAVVGEVLEGELPALTPHTPRRHELPRQLRAIRGQGYAVTHGELDPHAVGVAVAIPSGVEPVCSLSVAGPATRLDEQTVRRVLDRLREAARALASLLAVPGSGEGSS
jgi:DNA-binding IclR family transcriptional regulator